jgi:hypothetical protein
MRNTSDTLKNKLGSASWYLLGWMAGLKSLYRLQGCRQPRIHCVKLLVKLQGSGGGGCGRTDRLRPAEGLSGLKSPGNRKQMSQASCHNKNRTIFLWYDYENWIVLRSDVILLFMIQ